MAEALFLAYTEEQAAYLGGISKRTLARIRGEPIWQEIEKMSLAMERPFRLKVWKGAYGWQGAAWLLERKYPGQLSKPEVQLSLNTGANVTNNTLVITAEQATNLKNRNANLDEALSKLSPPASRLPVITPFMTGKDNEAIVSPPGDSSSNNTDTKTLCGERAIEEKPSAPGTRTPYARGSGPEPNLPPNSKILKGGITKKKEVGINSNYRPGIDIRPKKKPGVPKREELRKNIENFNILGDSSNNKKPERKKV